MAKEKPSEPVTLADLARLLRAIRMEIRAAAESATTAGRGVLRAESDALAQGKDVTNG